MTDDEREEFVAAYNEAWRRADRWAAAMQVSPDTARDAIQQVAAEALEAGPALRTAGLFLTFARHRLHFQRSWDARRSCEPPPEAASDKDDPARLAPAVETKESVREFIERLGPADRTVVERTEAGASLRETAAMIGESHEAVRLRLLHLRAHFAVVADFPLDSWGSALP